MDLLEAKYLLTCLECLMPDSATMKATMEAASIAFEQLPWKPIATWRRIGGLVVWSSNSLLSVRVSVAL